MSVIDGDKKKLPDEDLELEDELEDELEGEDEVEVEVTEESPDAEAEEGDDDEEGSRPETFEQEPEPEPQFKPKTSRSQERIRALANRNKELEDTVKRFTQGQQELSLQQQAAARHQQSQRQQAEYQQWYETLDPGQKYVEDLRRSTHQTQAELQAVKAQMFEAQDKASFRATLAERPQFKQFERQVEELYQKVRADGVFASRDLILNQVLGMAVRDQKGKAVSKKSADKRLAASKTKAAAPGSDVQRGNRRAEKGSLADLEARLKGRQF